MLFPRKKSRPRSTSIISSVSAPHLSGYLKPMHRVGAELTTCALQVAGCVHCLNTRHISKQFAGSSFLPYRCKGGSWSGCFYDRKKAAAPCLAVLGQGENASSSANCSNIHWRNEPSCKIQQPQYVAAFLGLSAPALRK